MVNDTHTSAKPRPMWVPHWLARGPRSYDGRVLTNAEFHEMDKIRPGRRTEILVGLVVIALFVAYDAWLEPVLVRALPPGPWIVELIVRNLPLIGLVVFMAWFHWTAPTAVRARRRRLRELGHPVCGHCGYDLSGGDANSGACPECGRDLSGMPAVPAGRPLAA